MLRGGMIPQGDANSDVARTQKKVAHPLVHIQKFLLWCWLPFVTHTVVVGAYDTARVSNSVGQMARDSYTPTSGRSLPTHAGPTCVGEI